MGIRANPLIGLVVLVCLGISGTAMADLSSITFSNPHIYNLGDDHYRFRVTAEWSVDPFFIGYDYPDDWDYGGPIDGDPIYAYGELNRITIGLSISSLPTLYSDYNPTINNHPAYLDPGYSTPGDWYGGGDGPSWVPLPLYGPEFGWDFDYVGALDAQFEFTCVGEAVWSGHYFLPDGTGSYRDAFPYNSETHSTVLSLGLDAEPIPEPVTGLLMGLGLLGIAVFRKRS